MIYFLQEMARFSSYLPSKTFRSVVASLVIVVFLIALSYFWPSNIKNTLTVSAVEPSIGQISRVIVDQDTDGDGLKDWEEALWKTDPYKKDTDGDGVSDGDEVKAGRNPAKAGPNDKTFLVPGVAGASDEPLTKTDIIARDLFGRYAEARQSGGTLDQPTEQQIISAVLSRRDLVSDPRSYGSTDLKIVGTADTEGLRAYGNAVGAFIKKYSVNGESEFAIFERAVADETPDELKKLDPIIASYESMIASMQTAAVPQNAAIVHLSLLNSMSAVLFSIKNMRDVYKDPASALLSLDRYLHYAGGLGQSLKDAHDFFGSKGIFFTKDDGGFYYADLVH